MLLATTLVVGLSILAIPGVHAQPSETKDHKKDYQKDKLTKINLVAYIGISLRIDQEPEIFIRHFNQQVTLKLNKTKFTWQIGRRYRIHGDYDQAKKVIYVHKITLQERYDYRQ